MKFSDLTSTQKKMVGAYVAGVLTTPAALVIFRKPIFGTLAWSLANPDMDERWEKIVERREKMHAKIVESRAAAAKKDSISDKEE